MRRRSVRTRTATSPVLVSVDSLMDILACTVGIVMVVILFSTLQFRGTSLKATMPLAQDPPTGSTKVTLICNDGKIRIYESDRNLLELLDGLERQSLSSLGGWVTKANAKGLKDEYFTYGLNYQRGEYFWGYAIRSPKLELTIKERPGFEGETLEQYLTDDSVIRRQLAGFSPENTWFSCAVDRDSLELFRAVREDLRSTGYVTGWDPTTLVFPVRFDFFTNWASDPLAPKPSLSTRQ